MASRKAKPVHYRRKREQKTDYKKRLRLLVSAKPRLVLRSSNTRFIAQVVVFTPQGDKVLASADSSTLKKEGWGYSAKNFPAAYLAGLLLARNAKKADAAAHGELIFDTGMVSPSTQGKFYAFLKGALDGGLQVRHGDAENFFPGEDRLNGKTIEAYATGLKEKDPEMFKKRFAANLKNSADPTKISSVFEQVRAKLMK